MFTKSPIIDRHTREAYLAHHRAQRLQNFKDGKIKDKEGRPAKKLRLKRVHVSGGHSHEEYDKQTVALRGFQTLDIITNQNLTHDTAVLFHTDGQGVNALLKMGLLNAQALTSKAIKALGKYRKKELEREIKSRIVSKLKAEKEALLNDAHKHIEDLQDLELRLGHRVYPDSAAKSAEEMLQDLDKYIEKQKLSALDAAYKASCDKNRKNSSKWSWKVKFHDTRIRNLEAANAENIKAAKELQALIRAKKDDASWLQNTGNEEILAFLKERIIFATREMQGLNQVLTHLHGSKVYFRGDLNSVAEDATKEVRDHAQDFHTPVTCAHQLRYDANQKVTVDSDFHTDGGLGELDNLMLGVSVVAGDNKPLDNLRGKVQETSAVKWRHWRSFYDFNKPYIISSFSSLKRFGAWLWDIVLSPFNMVETAFRGNNAGYFQSLRINEPEDASRLNGKTDYYALSARLNRETSISTKIGLEIYKAVNYLFVQGLWKGLTDGWKQIRRLPDDLRADFLNPGDSLSDVLAELKQALQGINESDHELLGCNLYLISLPEGDDIQQRRAEFAKSHPNRPLLFKQGENYFLWGNKKGTWVWTPFDRNAHALFGSLPFELNKVHPIRRGNHHLQRAVNSALSLGHDLAWHPQPSTQPLRHPPVSDGASMEAKYAEQPREEKAEEEKPEEEIVYAQPEIPLKPYASHGILNGGASGFVEFVDLFGHHMFAKHPFTATASTAAAVVSFLAFFSPALAVELFGKGYVKFLQDQGYIWTKDVFSASLAGSFTNFKLIGAIVEGLEHGPDSWLSKGFSHLINDPAKSVTYTTLAWLIGHALVFWLEVPGLSEELRSHIGNPPALSEIFGGAKIGLIGYHLFASPHGDHEAARQDYIKQCLENYVASEKKRGREVTDEKKAAIKACLEKMISPENVAKIRAQITQAQTAPKTAAETQAEGRLTFMMQLAANREKLPRLSPELKAKLRYNIQKFAFSSADATAIDHYLDPEKYAPKSTLRSFVGRTISYGPTALRCALSPIAFVATCFTGWVVGKPDWQSGAVAAFARPWKDLGSMLLDDLTSTTFALFRVVNKTFESLINRIPRTLADIVINGMLARALSFFGFHGFTLSAYRQSAKFDIAQEKVCQSTTGGIMTCLARKNTTPDPRVSLSYALDEGMRAQFSPLPVKLSALPLPAATRASAAKVPERKESEREVSAGMSLCAQ